MACVYKQGWCLQTGMRGVGGRGGGRGWRAWTYVWRPGCVTSVFHPSPPPVSSHRAATPSTASSVVFLSFCPQPPIPLTIPTHHAPHSKNQARAGTISTNHTTLSILSGRTRRVLDFSHTTQLRSPMLWKRWYVRCFLRLVCMSLCFCGQVV